MSFSDRLVFGWVYGRWQMKWKATSAILFQAVLYCINCTLYLSECIMLFTIVLRLNYTACASCDCIYSITVR